MLDSACADVAAARLAPVAPLGPPALVAAITAFDIALAAKVRVRSFVIVRSMVRVASGPSVARTQHHHLRSNDGRD